MAEANGNGGCEKKMVTIKVAICDDVPKEQEKIAKALATYAKAHPALRFETDTYSAAIDILHAVERETVYDVALLDICMPGILGTEAAKGLLSKSPGTAIIFLTTSDEYAVEAFAMGALHYLVKPFTQEQFDAAMERAMQKTAGQDMLTLSCVDGIYRVCIDEIVSIESQRHYLSLRLASGENLRLRRTLSSMAEEVMGYSGFVKIGASYIVNLYFVRKVSATSIEMTEGSKIPIPRRSSEAVQKAYMDFCRREALK